MAGPIDNIVQMYTGFSQKRETRNGFDTLFDLLYELNCDGLYTALPLRWNSWVDEDLSYNLRHLSEPDRRHYLVGYSYGGYAAMRYCWEAYKYAEPIDILFLIDAVWRLKGARWSWIARSRSMFPGKSLQIPPNVRRVVWWHQQVERPYGHPVVPAKGNTTTHFDQPNGIRVNLPHVAMEDYDGIHHKIVNDIRHDMKRNEYV